ncbi:hypothetical protein [Microbacterium radiodurans]|uniref:DUF2530 domain-containing protein n=1 Tax=Microbacterium radiodurans TaxID=661398 RepID=A0A5J5IPE2_9MICO|nr:hypothetical protein [Microbacterium radiodurans]KAA9085312.1 hypothetical protein F6B42_12635 [Microbacterium radiodurans]
MRRVVERWGRKYAGSMFSLAVVQSVLWTVLAVIWTAEVIREWNPWRLPLIVGSLGLALGWGVVATSAGLHRRRLRDAARSKVE